MGTPAVPPISGTPTAAGKSPAPKGSRARTPVRRRIIVLVTLGAILLTALLNSGELVKQIEQMPFGWQRTLALRFADTDQKIATSLRLDRPRGALDQLLGHGASTTTVPVSTTTTSVPVSTTTTVPAPPRQRPTVANPLTVYFGGDSLGVDVAEGFEQLAGASRVISVTDDARISTGLTRPDYFNWPARLQQVLAAKPPRVVIVMFGANDIQPIMTPSGPAQVGTPEWLAEYRRRVAATMATLAASRANVYWVGQPLMQSAQFSKQVSQLDEIYASEARLHPGITFVDTRQTLANAQGQYSAYLPTSGGQTQQVRTPDGIHLTLAGAERIASAIVAAMRRYWILSI